MTNTRTRPLVQRIATIILFALVGVAVVATPAQAVSPLHRIDLGASTGPKGVAFSPDGSLAFVALEDFDKVSVIDATTDTHLVDISVGDAPINVTVSPDGALAYVVLSAAGAIDVIDIASLSVVGIPIPVGTYPTDVVFSPDSTTAYVAGYASGSIYVIDVATSTVTDTVTGLSEPQNIVIEPDGATLWFVGGYTVQSLDATTLAVGAPIAMGDVDYPAAHPRILEMSADGSTLATGGDGSPKVYIIDTGSETVTGAVDIGDNTYAIAFAPSGSQVFAGRANLGGIAVIDPTTATLVDTFATDGVWPWGMAMAPGGDRGYATNYDDDSITVFGDGVTRTSGTDRYKTAIAVSQAAYPAGSDIVFIATAGNFPDALSAGPAASAVGGPLLLTASTSLPASVKAEIQRLSPVRIVVIGGTGVVSTTVFNQLSSLATGGAYRIFGANRYETSRQIASQIFVLGANDVYIATGRNFPDALGASAIGAAFGRPVILVDGNASSVDAATLTLLSSLGVTNVRIAGGTGVVSQGIEDQLGALYTVSRFGGATRYETSNAINSDGYPNPGDATRAFIATGVNFPDALAGSAWAGRVHAPLFIVPGTCVPQPILDSIMGLGVYQVTLIGGTGVLTQSVFDLTACP